MSKGRIFLLAIGAVLLIGATGRPDETAYVHNVVYTTPRVAAQQTLTSGVEIRYTASVSHGSQADRRSVSVEIIRPNVTQKNIAGSPDQIDSIADSITAACAAIDAAPRSAQASGRDIGLETTVEDIFPSLGISLITDSKYVTFKREQTYDLSVRRTDAAQLVASFHDAAALARSLP